MNIPRAPYVALYGSHSGPWRAECQRGLDAENVRWYDPTDPQWAAVTDANGDEQQELVDALVAKQHRAMRGAACVIFHLASSKEGKAITAFAARCELGFLIGHGIITFAHIEPDVVGRNYLWAAIKPYPHMMRMTTLAEAVESAIAHVKGA
jgi:hypothetical protein